jgi:hypothetical protein
MTDEHTMRDWPLQDTAPSSMAILRTGVSMPNRWRARTAGRTIICDRSEIVAGDDASIACGGTVGAGAIVAVKGPGVTTWRAMPERSSRGALLTESSGRNHSPLWHAA